LFFNRRKSTIQIFSQYFIDILNILKGSSLDTSKDFISFELMPFLYVISDFAIASANKDRLKFSTDIMEFLLNSQSDKEGFAKILQERIDFYGEVIRGKKLRGYCMMGAFEENTPPLLRCTVAFTDIIIDPNCSEDYDNAPFCVYDMFQMLDFSTKTMPLLTRKVTSLFQDMYKAKL